MAVVTYGREEPEVIAHRAALSMAVASPSHRDALLLAWTEPLDVFEIFDVIRFMNTVLLSHLDVLRRLMNSDHEYDQGVEMAKATAPALPAGYPDPTSLEG